MRPYIKELLGSFLSLFTIEMSLEVLEVLSTLPILENITALISPENTTFNSNLTLAF